MVHMALKHPRIHTAVEMNYHHLIIQNNCILTIVIFQFPQWQPLTASWKNDPLACINELFLEIQYSPAT